GGTIRSPIRRAGPSGTPTTCGARPAASSSSGMAARVPGSASPTPKSKPSIATSSARTRLSEETEPGRPVSTHPASLRIAEPADGPLTVVLDGDWRRGDPLVAVDPAAARIAALDSPATLVFDAGGI